MFCSRTLSLAKASASSLFLSASRSSDRVFSAFNYNNNNNNPTKYSEKTVFLTHFSFHLLLRLFYLLAARLHLFLSLGKFVLKPAQKRIFCQDKSTKRITRTGTHFLTAIRLFSASTAFSSARKRRSSNLKGNKRADLLVSRTAV